MTLAGFPHSGITGSTPTCGSPMLFAAYHALLRLSVPRHPPCALIRLTGYAHAHRTLPERRRRRVGIPVHLADTRVAPSSLSLRSTLTPNPLPKLSIDDPGAGVLTERSTCEDFPALASLTRRSRKEVIQPQVPLRLPCYDFAPVTELAFGRCPPCGLAHGLRALPTSMA